MRRKSYHKYICLQNIWTEEQCAIKPGHTASLVERLASPIINQEVAVSISGIPKNDALLIIVILKYLASMWPVAWKICDGKSILFIHRLKEKINKAICTVCGMDNETYRTLLEPIRKGVTTIKKTKYCFFPLNFSILRSYYSKLRVKSVH